MLKKYKCHSVDINAFQSSDHMDNYIMNGWFIYNPGNLNVCADILSTYAFVLQ